MKKLVLNIGVLLLALLGGVSCNIKEDMSNCPGSMILDYSAYQEEILDDIALDEQIDVFIFNPSGICVDIRTFTYGELRKDNFEFELPIKYRNYNAVVWQGLNSSDYDSHTMVLGTGYDDFYAKLETDLSKSSFSGVPSSLWATPLEPIEYCAKITRHRVYMTRLHTEVKVTLQEKLLDGSLRELNADDYNITIEAANNIYHTDYTVDEGCTTLKCVNEGSMVGTLRITPDMTCTLTVDGVDHTIDLVKYMLESKSDDSISDQLFLDLNKVWDIKLIVKQEPDGGYIALGISINGWVVWFSSSELS